MGVLEKTDAFETIRVRSEAGICYIQIDRLEANNTINNYMVNECMHVIDDCEVSAKIVVIEGSPEVFCFGADFRGIQRELESKDKLAQDPKLLYGLWQKLSFGPYITIAHVRGKVNAGGIGFIAACDVVLSETKAVFSLSEMLFGMIPACVFPFLVRRIGFSKANYMALMTRPFSADEVQKWGLVDAYDDNSENLLRKHLLRLRLLSKNGVKRYKKYMKALDDILGAYESKALEANKETFSDQQNLENIARYVKTSKFPWENE